MQGTGLHSKPATAKVATQVPSEPLVPLYVDLDGTLIRSNLLVESFLSAMKSAPWILFLVPFWLLKGRAHLKYKLAQLAEVDGRWLPYNDRFIDYLKSEHERGRSIILATAANQMLANKIAAHLGIFDAVIASDEKTNRKGSSKLSAINAHSGGLPFDYAGNAIDDLPIWEAARGAVLVNASARTRRVSGGRARIDRIFERPNGILKHYLLALRPHQWAKNLLVFLPLVAAHQYGDPLLVGKAIVAFLSMSLAASGTYVVNDLLDLSADRQHPRKRLRSFASGNASLAGGIVLAIGCLAASLSLAFLLPPSFVAVLCTYIGITLLYSWYIKRVPLLDVLTLSGLFTLRVIAGGAAVAIAPSFWLLMFSVFVFLSLALVKRYAELLTMRENGKSVANGRGYLREDLPMLEIVGLGSGLLSVLVIALYVHSPEIGLLYRAPEIFWLLCPIGLYLVLRIWMVAHRGQMHHDPVVFVLCDRASLLAMAVAAGVIWMAL